MDRPASKLSLPIWGALAHAALLLGCSGPQTAMEPPPLVRPDGTPGVELTLPRLGGGKLAIESYRGHPVLITLFTTWCLRCQAEAPLFINIYEQRKPRGLKMVGVALDDLTKLSMVQTYVEFVGFTFPVLVAEPNDLELVSALGPTKRVPRTVLLDRAGRIVEDHVAQTHFDRLERALDKLTEK